jgi:hypothetical protein
MPLLVKRTQHAIGQGGFHSSYLYAGDERFSLVFDCGGSTEKHRASVIGPVVEQGKHDWLVVSHLDEDHINGVSQLESAGVTFSNVFLPHVDLSHQLFLMLLRSAGTVTVASEEARLNSLLIVGKLYAGSYGRARVVIPGERDRGDRPRQEIFPLSDGPEQRRLPDLTPEDARPSVLLDEQAQKSLGVSGTRTFQDTQSIYISGKNWEMRFYSDEWAFPAPVAKLWALPVLRPLRNAMEHLSLLGTNGGGGFTRGIGAALKAQISAAAANAAIATIDPAFPKVSRAISVNSLLKKLYQALPDLHDYNSSSLCLYSGPATSRPPEHWRYMRSMNLPDEQYQRRHHAHSVGWLGMGDAHLHDASALRRFRGHYEGRFKLLSTLVLPHHGSRHNYDAERIQLHRLLAPISYYDTPVFVAASNPRHKKFKHPHQEVVKIARMYGDLHNVSLNPSTAFSEIVVEHV